MTLFPKLSLPGVVRVSLGIENSEEDVDRLIQTLDKIASKPRALNDRDFASTPDLSRKVVQQQIDNFVEAATQRVYTQS